MPIQRTQNFLPTKVKRPATAGMTVTPAAPGSGGEGETVGPATTTSLGIVLAATAPTDPANPIALMTTTPIAGDVVGAYNSGAGDIATTVEALQGNPVSSAVPSTGQILVWNGTDWIPGTFQIGTALIGTLGTTSWTLPFTPVLGYVIFADGAVWQLGTDYTAVGTAITTTIAVNEWIICIGI